ncbi:glutamine--fructose-6-phosphate transaminase (isomerizing) [Wohlfahrtiimonas chitiniclastica]|uniref:glutamine--fructose-6-phosphate transaminase (isomerizing) n=1 Tax=Wohlfahrtiimonas chitiniclastica TaxID=400946 RepID=UPI000B98913F|nr:glutamine--fructose-6-phosphate transaminase (isomerizing) [Wohlfahrtiimonas chitiniclastica]OYQ70772.1 glutamine--fructose-6-phosphate transaminase (isomerizing) [Wohlfahrtiimonas chitiniclastica]OYQ81945.1 glutamine--fructose-6-phosphate transaminase (isomerizing) [Wohlfahrtiimonas chitiniclastica]OYQ83978.1 glutamine--fructose-6-phosphate transaminase (isomerizing) [Wohlfahrtiimonas chitiniclastica]OYQ84817.1 glutamine--fructose-6-phosphate transaminase (isomerizing) [Wohlfahrtiimonas chi
MCGIVGAIAERNICPVLLSGLKRLEYRGYDSAGVALIDHDELFRERSLGKVAALEAKVFEHGIKGSLGIAHTRWATHGIPHERNAHPHVSGTIAVVHNGIIENYQELKATLVSAYQFDSETDTEVIAHLIHHYRAQGMSLYESVQAALEQLEGAFSIAVVDSTVPDELIAAKKGTPLVVGIGIGEYFIASDPFALLPVTNQFIYLEDFDCVKLKRDALVIKDKAGRFVERAVKQLYASDDAADKGLYKHYMLKEIYEQPKALSDTLQNRLKVDLAQLLGCDAQMADQIEAVHINACGTSYHAGLVAKYWFESIGIACYVEVASEYRYRQSVTPKNTLFISISQSGETLDTIEALKLAKQKPFLGYLAITNSADSAITRESNWTILTHAGREIGVASTKAFTTQLTVLLMLADAFSHHKDHAMSDALTSLPFYAESMLALDETIEKISAEFAESTSALFVARGILYPIAMEGALKLKEISYIHAESYPAGELKHGPLALVDKNMPVIAIVTKNALTDKMIANLEEINARNGRLYIFKERSVTQTIGFGHEIELPEMPEMSAPILVSIALQLFSYHVACIKGTDVDQPRNLAKSVTVE